MAYHVKHVSLYVKHVFTRKAAAKLRSREALVPDFARGQLGQIMTDTFPNIYHRFLNSTLLFSGYAFLVIFSSNLMSLSSFLLRIFSTLGMAVNLLSGVLSNYSQVFSQVSVKSPLIGPKELLEQLVTLSMLSSWISF